MTEEMEVTTEAPEQTESNPPAGEEFTPEPLSDAETALITHREEGGRVTVAYVSLDDTGLPFAIIDRWIIACQQSSFKIALVFVGDGVLKDAITERLAHTPDECGPAMIFAAHELTAVLNPSDLVCITDCDATMRERIAQIQQANEQMQLAQQVQQEMLSLVIVRGKRVGNACIPGADAYSI